MGHVIMYIMKKETKAMANIELLEYYTNNKDEYFVKLRVTEGYEKRIVMMSFDSYQNLGHVDIVETVDDTGTLSDSDELLQDVFSDEVIEQLREMNEIYLERYYQPFFSQHETA
jgi:hypothetical protein